MTEKIIISGFGGQGIMSIGKIIAYAGMMEDKNVTWLPSYGPEMRGGTANCNVIVSNNIVASPIVTEATSVIVLNKPSLDKFESYVISEGKLLINSSLIEKKETRCDINTLYIPASQIALELGNAKIANIVMLGAYLELTKLVKYDTVIKVLKEIFGKSSFVDIDIKALYKGANYIN